MQISDEFAKFDFSSGVDLDAIADATMEEGGDFTDFLSNIVQEVLDSVGMNDLDGYYAYRIVTADRSYYPQKGTIKALPTGQVLFHEGSYESEKPVLVTLERTAVEAIYWLFDEEAVAEESEAA